MFVYGDVVYAQTWQVLTLKNCMEPFSYASAAYVVASALVSVRLFCKNLGKRAKIFWANCLPPPLAKNSPYAYDQGCSTKRPIILKVLEESGKVLRSLDQSYQMYLL